MERTIICISRQYGSGGREVGEAAAKKLGIPCYDKYLIQQAARETGLSEQSIANYDEKGTDFVVVASGDPLADSTAFSEASSAAAHPRSCAVRVAALCPYFSTPMPTTG